MKIKLPLSPSAGDEERFPENIYKYKISENELKSLCKQSNSRNEFKSFVDDCVNDDDYDNTNIIDFIKKNKFGIVYIDNESWLTYVYCISDNKWYKFEIENDKWKASIVNYNTILNLSKQWYSESYSISNEDDFNILLEQAFLAGYIDAEEDFLNKDNSFNLEDEYNNYYNEAKFMYRVQHAIGKFINNSKYADPKERELANRALAARLGTQQAADKEDEVVMDTYKKYDKASKDKLINSHDNYVTKKHIENKYNYKLKRAIKDRAAQQPAAGNKSKQPKPVFRPAFA